MVYLRQHLTAVFGLLQRKSMRHRKLHAVGSEGGKAEQQRNEGELVSTGRITGKAFSDLFNFSSNNNYNDNYEDVYADIGGDKRDTVALRFSDGRERQWPSKCPSRYYCWDRAWYCRRHHGRGNAHILVVAPQTRMCQSKRFQGWKCIQDYLGRTSHKRLTVVVAVQRILSSPKLFFICFWISS